MNELSRIEDIKVRLGGEITRTCAGSTEGQFPILDLLGNLRDEARKSSELEKLAVIAQDAWQKLVGIVESGHPFTSSDIQWLQDVRQKAEMCALPCAHPGGAGVEGAGSAPEEPTREATRTGVGPTAEEDLLTLNIQDDADLLREFLNESREHLDNIEQGVLVLERCPTDAETLSTIFRAFHTFKGSAGFLNLIPINRLAHRLETLLDLIRQDKLKVNGVVVELILRGRDKLKLFLDAIEGQLSGKEAPGSIRVETTTLKDELQAVIAGAPQGHAATETGAPQPQGNASESTTTPEAVPAAGGVQPAAPAKETSPAGRGSEPSSVVRVDTGKLDALLDLIGEMVISQSLVSANLNRLAEQDAQFARNIAQLSRITKELQRVGMSMRMMPVRGVFQKMARVVRDIGTKQKKRVQLVTEGEDTELDRGVVEELNDPLLHMIRNSVDHGIEPEEVRIKAGKPALGTIHLRAFHQGGNIVIEIEDDGAGLNRDKILAKAIERGLATPATKLSDEEIFRFIFAAGFSTAEKVTDISGRGVGLDVVRRNIEHLRGCVDISSEPGHWTRFKITLPLTLAIIDGLVVRVGDERYIIPTLSVRESFRAQPQMVTRVQNRAEVVDVRGRLIPLLRLYEHFGLKPKSTDVGQGIIVVAQSGADFRCLLVDSLESKQEVVIKNLNDLLVHKNRSLAGAAILGDGRVGLILDVNSLVHQQNQPFAEAA